MLIYTFFWFSIINVILFKYRSDFHSHPNKMPHIKRSIVLSYHQRRYKSIIALLKSQSICFIRFKYVWWSVVRNNMLLFQLKYSIYYMLSSWYPYLDYIIVRAVLLWLPTLQLFGHDGPNRLFSPFFSPHPYSCILCLYQMYVLLLLFGKFLLMNLLIKNFPCERESAISYWFSILPIEPLGNLFMCIKKENK